MTIVGVLIGSVVFLADLIRRIDLPLRLELVQARSYRGDSTRPGPLVLNLDLLSSDVRGRDVLLVDDILTPATRCGNCCRRSTSWVPPACGRPCSCGKRDVARCP